MRRQLLRLVLYLLALPLSTYAAFQHITVSSSPSMDPVASVNMKIGCIPSTFSDNPDTFPSSKAVLASPEDACYPEEYTDPQLWQLDNQEAIKGNIAIVRRCKTCNCYFDEKAMAAYNAGATGVIIINDNEEGVLPITAGQYHDDYSSYIPVCMVTYDDGESILNVVESGTDVYISFENVFPEDLGDVPDTDFNLLTYLDVLTPWEVKWRYPASNCLWNPPNQTFSASIDPVTAKLVKAEIVMSCPFDLDPNHYNCASRGCHVVGVSNEAELEGNFALFLREDFDGDQMCHDVQELAAAAQIAGAAGVIASSQSYWSLPLFDAPKYSPFDFTIQTYIVPGSYASDWYSLMQAGEDVVVKFPPSEGEYPETYYPHVDVMGALPETTVCAKESNRDKECFPAGQARFNPVSFPALSAELIIAEVHESCHDVEDLDGKDGSGLDCVTCADLLQQDEAITNKDKLAGKIALVRASQTFCINEWEDLVDNLEAHGAEGLLVGNENNYTYTMVDSEEDEVTKVPVFNVAIDSMERILELYFLPNTVQMHFPALLGSEVVPKNVTSYHQVADDDESHLGLTQIEIEKPKRLAGKIEAGQADFNKEFEGGRFNLYGIHFYEFCDSQLSCHKCNLLSRPLTDHFPKGGAAILDARSASCFNPIGSVVRFIQDAGAEAVIVVNDGNELLTLSNGGSVIDDDLRIPVFNIGREPGEPLIEELLEDEYSSTKLSVRLPKIKKVIEESEDGEEEIIFEAPEVLDPDSIDYDENESNDEESKRRGGFDSPSFDTGSPLGGVVMMLVILSLVLAFIGLRHLNKLRNTRRMLGVYNQLNAGTQVTNTTHIGDSGGTALQQGAGVAAFRQPEVILTARPWKSASPSKPQAAGVFGLLDFRGSGGKTGGTIAELEMSSMRSVGMASPVQVPVVEASYMIPDHHVGVGGRQGYAAEGKSCDTDSDDEAKPSADNRRPSAAPLLNP
mmetsp:Transcript_9199/g.18432  ORF Transcript_9199/g.18432 Transcript_9199/m.18432 type:complete len:966 (-) Transcript_9199:30-2927(-)